MLREYRISSALADSDVPHTRAVAACADTDVLGATFYLMDFVDGWSPISEPHWPEPFDSDLGARRGLAFELVDAIARLSQVDWKARGLEGLGRPDGFHDRQVDRWYAHLSRFEFREIPGLDEAVPRPAVDRRQMSGALVAAQEKKGIPGWVWGLFAVLVLGGGGG